MSVRRVAWLAWAAALGACASSAPPASKPAPSNDAAFPRAAELLGRFDAPDAGGDWRVGDELLFGVRLENGESARTWYVAMRVDRMVESPVAAASSAPGGESRPTITVIEGRTFTASFTGDDGRVSNRASSAIPLTVRVWDGDARSLGTAAVEAPERFLREGFHGPCRRTSARVAEFNALAAQRSAPGTGAPEIVVDDAVKTQIMNDFMQAFSALIAFLQTFQTAAPLEEVRRAVVDEVVDAPSILSVIFHGGVSVGVNPHMERVTPETGLAVGGAPSDGLRLPVEILVNDALVMRYDLVVVPPDPPERVAAGVVAIEGAHPRDPSRRFFVRLLGARRGDPAR